MGTLALIGLGSNLGDRKANLDGALAALSGTPGIEVRAVSSFHETASVGGPRGQGAFLNAAAALEVGLSPPELLRALHAIEAGARRFREVCWGVRTLDLDLLLFGDQILDTPALLVPHPRMAVRRFVLAPLAEVTPKAVDPLTRRTIAELLANLDRRPRYLALANDGAADLFSRLVAELSAVGLHRGKQASDWENLEILDQRARELRADRWTTDLWGGRWVITDFWFDDLIPLARPGMGIGIAMLWRDWPVPCRPTRGARADVRRAHRAKHLAFRLRAARGLGQAKPSGRAGRFARPRSSVAGRWTSRRLWRRSSPPVPRPVRADGPRALVVVTHRAPL